MKLRTCTIPDPGDSESTHDVLSEGKRCAEVSVAMLLAPIHAIYDGRLDVTPWDRWDGHIDRLERDLDRHNAQVSLRLKRGRGR